jgi:hypothetical protein
MSKTSRDYPHDSAISQDLLKQLRVIRKIHLDMTNNTEDRDNERIFVLQREFRMSVAKAIGDLDIRLQRIEAKVEQGG